MVLEAFTAIESKSNYVFQRNMKKGKIMEE